MPWSFKFEVDRHFWHSFWLILPMECAWDIRTFYSHIVWAVEIFLDYYFTIVEQVQKFKKLVGGSHKSDSLNLSSYISIEGLINLFKPVVNGITSVVKDLYEFGLKRFVVSKYATYGTSISDKCQLYFL